MNTSRESKSDFTQIHSATERRKSYWDLVRLFVVVLGAGESGNRVREAERLVKMEEERYVKW
jgi:hypothetical protein